MIFVAYNPLTPHIISTKMKYMKGLLSSFNLLFGRYKAEIILITVASVCLVISISTFTNSSKIKTDPTTVNENVPTDEPSKKIYVDLEGSVQKTGIYEVTSGARLKDILITSEGLSANADRLFFARNFNLSQLLVDQEKIYIPSVAEVESGLISENPNSESKSQDKISLNQGSESELDSLPGVGTATIQKIISGRPYGSVNELIDRKIVSEGTFTKIKELIDL